MLGNQEIPSDSFIILESDDHDDDDLLLADQERALLCFIPVFFTILIDNYFLFQMSLLFGLGGLLWDEEMEEDEYNQEYMEYKFKNDVLFKSGSSSFGLFGKDGLQEEEFEFLFTDWNQSDVILPSYTLMNTYINQFESNLKLDHSWLPTTIFDRLVNYSNQTSHLSFRCSTFDIKDSDLSLFYILLDDSYYEHLKEFGSVFTFNSDDLKISLSQKEKEIILKTNAFFKKTLEESKRTGNVQDSEKRRFEVERKRNILYIINERGFYVFDDWEYFWIYSDLLEEHTSYYEILKDHNNVLKLYKF